MYSRVSELVRMKEGEMKGVCVCVCVCKRERERERWWLLAIT